MPRNCTRILTLLLAALPLSQRAAADPPVDPTQWHTCKPVMAHISFGNQFQVKCDVPWENPSTNAAIRYFSIETTNEAHVAQAMSTVHTAQIAGKRIRLKFRHNSPSLPNGCDSECALLLAIAVRD